MKRPRAFVLVALLAVCACSGQSGNADRPSSRSPSASAELAYGAAPVADAGITYQPDVILVGGGADMVRSVSRDSLTWSIDERAPHVDELEPGKVMFLTGRGVGRVLALEHHGDVVAVTLGPVDLTDVISDGDLHVSAPIDVGAITFQTYPDVPGLAETSTPPVNPTATNAAYVAQPAAEDTLPPPSKGSSVEVSAGDFAAELGRKVTGEENELSLKLGYTKKGVTVGLEFAAKLEAPQVEANLSFHDGALGKNELRVEGLKEVSLGLVSGSETGLSGNFKSRVEVPAEMTFPLPGGPVPLVGSIRFKFIVETAFSARNATMTATGRLKVDGPIGFSGSTLLLPSVTQVESPVEDLAGVSVGVNGVVVALQMKVVIGIGIPAALVGPFAAVTVSYGLTNGSSIGIVQCRQSSIDVVLAGGAGFTFAPGELKWLELLGKKLPWAPKIDSELASGTQTVVHTIDYLPKVPVCRP